MGRINSAVIDTSCGAPGVFATPEGWQGDAKAYRRMMRGRLKDIEAYQHIMLAVWTRQKNPGACSIKGPWADEAAKMLDRLLAPAISDEKAA
jgi:hypothetical protein